jgi:hypothetical protein
MNLPSDVQRLLPYIAVAVLAVVGLVVVMRGVGAGNGGGEPAPEPPRIVQPAKPGGSTGKPDGGAGKARERTPVKRSKQAYISCVQQATDTTALERCQAFLPRR